MVKTPKDIKEKVELAFKVAMLKKLHKPRIPVETVEKEHVKPGVPEADKLLEDTTRLVEKVVKDCLPLVESMVEAYKVDFPSKIVLMPYLQEELGIFVVFYGYYDEETKTIYLNTTQFFGYRYSAIKSFEAWSDLGKLDKKDINEAAKCATEWLTIYYLLHELYHHLFHQKYPELAKKMHEDEILHEDEEFNAGIFAMSYSVPVLYAYLNCKDTEFEKYMKFVTLINEDLSHSTSDELLSYAKYELENILSGNLMELKI